jgi:hypothetical protein
MMSEPTASLAGDDVAVSLHEPARRGTSLPRDRSRLGRQDVLCRRKILHTGPGGGSAFRQPALRNCAATGALNRISQDVDMVTTRVNCRFGGPIVSPGTDSL